MRILRKHPTQHPPTPWKIAIITGLSDPTSCELHPTQNRFLIKLREHLLEAGTCAPLESFVFSNFPFVGGNGDQHRPPGLVRASLSNILQFSHARRHSRRIAGHPHWQSFLSSSPRVRLIAGSCGLELIANGLKGMDNPPRVDVIALGPVARRQAITSLNEAGVFSLRCIYGANDWIATRGLPAFEERTIPKLGHMGYWEHQEVLRQTCSWLQDRIFE